MAASHAPAALAPRPRTPGSMAGAPQHHEGRGERGVGHPPGEDRPVRVDVFDQLAMVGERRPDPDPTLHGRIVGMQPAPLQRSEWQSGPHGLRRVPGRGGDRDGHVKPRLPREEAALVTEVPLLAGPVGERDRGDRQEERQQRRRERPSEELPPGGDRSGEWSEGCVHVEPRRGVGEPRVSGACSGEPRVRIRASSLFG